MIGLPALSRIQLCLPACSGCARWLRAVRFACSQLLDSPANSSSETPHTNLHSLKRIKTKGMP